MFAFALAEIALWIWDGSKSTASIFLGRRTCVLRTMFFVCLKERCSIIDAPMCVQAAEQGRLGFLAQAYPV